MPFTERQPLSRLPPEACAPHSMMCPATVPAATLSQSSGDQPNSWKIGPEREPGVGDPAGDDDVGAAAERLDDRRHAEVGVGARGPGRGCRTSGRPVSMSLSAWPRRDQLVEPAEDVVARSPARPAACRASPSLRATSSTASAQPRGFTPPALEVTRMPRSTMSGQDPLHQRHEVARVAGARDRATSASA